MQTAHLGTSSSTCQFPLLLAHHRSFCYLLEIQVVGGLEVAAVWMLLLEKLGF